MGTVRKILPEFAQNLQLLQLRDNENLWPSRLSPRFCNPGLWSSQQSSALNEFQFPGFITQPGAGGRGLVVTPKLVRISPCSCQLVHCLSLCGFITCFCGLMSHVFSPPGPWHFPTFSLDPSPRQVVVNSNGPVVVPCAFNSPPGKKPEIRWKKDGLLLDLPSHGRRLLGNGSLVVDGDGDSSAGSYQCVASLAGVGTLLSTITRVNPAGEFVKPILHHQPSACPE